VLKRFPKQAFAIEIKEKSKPLIQATVEILKKYGDLETVIIGSKYDVVSRYLRGHYPELRRFCSRRDILSILFELRMKRKTAIPEPRTVASVPTQFLGLRFDTEEWIDFLHQKKMSAFFWTINEPSLIKSLNEKKADGIISDNPGLVNEVLGRQADF